MMHQKLELQMLTRPKLYFTVPDIPRPKDRPRARIVRPRFKPESVSFYNTKEVERAEDNIRSRASIAMMGQGVEKFTTAISVAITFFVPIPKSFSGVRRGKANGNEILPVTKPDLDNYVKLVMDAMNKVVYQDDNLVVDISAKKRYSDNPGTVVSIEEIFFDDLLSV